MNTITLIALILIGLGGLGGILLVIGQARSSFEDKTEIISTTKNENKELKQQITELKDERVKLNENLEERDKKIQEQNSKIENLSSKLVEKSEYIEKYVSGGESYPRIEIGELINANDGNSKLSFSLRNSFELPIYNIVIQAYDYDELQSKTFLIGDKKSIKLTDYDNSRIIDFQRDLLTPLSSVTGLGTFTLKTYRLYIKIHTRNKTLIQKIAIINYEDHYYSGFTIYDLSSKKVIEENFNNNSPTKAQIELKEKLETIPNNITHSILE